jgi:hypothetical protein
MRIRSWWKEGRELVELVWGLPRSLLAATRYGRATRLRDEGRLDEAFREANRMLKLLRRARHPMTHLDLIHAAALLEELARKRGTPEAAAPAMEEGLAAIEKQRREMAARRRRGPAASSYDAVLNGYEHLFLGRLGRLPSPPPPPQNGEGPKISPPA